MYQWGIRSLRHANDCAICTVGRKEFHLFWQRLPSTSCEHDGRHTSKPRSNASRRISDESRPKCVAAALAGLSQLLYCPAGKPLQVGLSAVRILPQLLRLLLKPLQAHNHNLSGFTDRMLIESLAFPGVSPSYRHSCNVEVTIDSLPRRI
jgi:hypothetical protein